MSEKIEKLIPDEGVARAVLIEAFGLSPVSIGRFGTGSHHYVYDCPLLDGRHMVARIATLASRSSMLGAAACSDRLRPRGVPLPEILAPDLDGRFPYLMLERLPGTDLGHVIDDLWWYASANGLAEIAVNRGRADSALGLALGSPVAVVA
jgi:hypothetical protein